MGLGNLIQNKFYVYPTYLTYFLKVIKMKKQFLQLSPEQELSYARESFASALSQGMTHASDFASKLKETFPSIIRGFAPVKDVVILPELIQLNKDQSKFMKTIHDIPYSELRELKAYTPEGVFVTYLEFIQVLHPVTEYLKGIQKNVTSPYLLLLAQVVSDTKASGSSNNHRNEYQKLEAYREAAYKQFSKLYAKDSFKAETQVKHVIERNADWGTVLHLLNQCVANMQAIDREAIKNQIQQCSDYLDILYKYLNENKLNGTSLEAAQSLSDGAYQVAQELTFLSTTYYRVLALNGSVENTIAHVVKSVG